MRPPVPEPAAAGQLGHDQRDRARHDLAAGHREGRRRHPGDRGRLRESNALALDSVGSEELKGVTARIGAGVGSNNTFVDASVSCMPGEMLISGGYAWTVDTAVDMVASAPDDPTTGNQN